MKTTLWHVTKEVSAERIVADGFRDGPFRERPDLRGVYLADVPTWDAMPNAVPLGFAAIAVAIDLRHVAECEVTDEPAEYREFFVPAETLNTYGTLYTCYPAT